MNRKIKFRVWDRALNKMITKENVKELLDTVNTGDCDTDYTYSRDEWYPAYDILIIFDYFEDIQYRYIEDTSTKRFELMQYTGLHDKNGKEIYEGDIVLYQDWEMAYEGGGNDSFINKGIVEYREDNCCFNVTERQTVDLADVLYKDNEDLEVIGNIYNNPELLGGEYEC